VLRAALRAGLLPAEVCRKHESVLLSASDFVFPLQQRSRSLTLQHQCALKLPAVWRCFGSGWHVRGGGVGENCQECQNCQKSPKVEGKTLPRINTDERGSGTLLNSAQARASLPHSSQNRASTPGLMGAPGRLRSTRNLRKKVSVHVQDRGEIIEGSQNAVCCTLPIENPPRERIVSHSRSAIYDFFHR
jgi:hypothetical protein